MTRLFNKYECKKHNMTMTTMPEDTEEPECLFCRIERLGPCTFSSIELIKKHCLDCDTNKYQSCGHCAVLVDWLPDIEIKEGEIK